jgi:hypothetical protein
VIVEVRSEKEETVESGGQISEKSEKERADIAAVVRGKRRLVRRRDMVRERGLLKSGKT